MSVNVPPINGPSPMPPNMARFRVPIYFPSWPLGANSAAYAMATGIVAADPIPCRNLKVSNELKSHAKIYSNDTMA